MSEDLARRLEQLLQAYGNGALDEDTFRAAAGGLGADVQALLQGSGSIAQGEGATALGAGATYVKEVHGNVYIGPEPEDPDKALNIYRHMLARTTSFLPLRGVDLDASDPTCGQESLSLANVYVDLDTTMPTTVPKLERSESGLRVVPVNEDEARPLGALEATIDSRRLVLLGDPGGGKSTFANHLAHCLARHALDPDAGWLGHLDRWPGDEAGILPLIVVLRDFARDLPDDACTQAEPQHLWGFIQSRLVAQNLNFAIKPIHDLLEKGRVLVLLDGLDEVPSEAGRAFVRDAVSAFVDRYGDNRYLITCRTLSYRPPDSPDEPDLRLPRLPTFELAPFDEDKINRFIGAWYVELARLGTVRGEDTDGLTARLKQAVRRPDLWRLAPNPLLLTVMALVHTHKGELPDARALLYEDVVDILLWRWERLKPGSQEDIPHLRQLLTEAGRSEMDLKRVLWKLAHEAHAQSGDGEDGEKLADIGELVLLKALAALKSDDLTWAQQVVEAMRLRAGMLLERVPEVFTFPHRTFQEYLAGAYLSSEGDFHIQATRLAEEGTSWREVILLAVGRLVYVSGDLAKPLALVGELCPSAGVNDPVGWRKAWLAGDVLLEIGAKRAEDSTLGRDLLERVRHRLVELLKGGQLSPRERASAGNTLAQLDDPRFRSNAWYLPDDLLLGFAEVPAGPFLMGTREEDVPALLERFGGERRWYEEETPQHTRHLPVYQM